MKRVNTLSSDSDTLKMKNIILAGLVYDLNLGDQVIYECTKKMVQNIINIKNEAIDIRSIDLYGRECEDRNKRVTLPNIYYKKINRRIFGWNHEEKHICKALYKQCLKKINDNTIGIIFVGGGLIKYQHQILSEPLILILNYAQEKNIPIMFSAVGVEGYDENDKNCQRLKKALNTDNIYSISTRDNLNLLQNSYIENKKINCSKVSDPACFTNEYYPTQVKNTSPVIGFNISRLNLFKSYGCGLTQTDVISLWKSLFIRAKGDGFYVKIFSNGLPEDYYSSKRIYREICDDKCILSQRPLKIEDLISIINSETAIVTTRLHASIMCESYGIPYVSLVWNPKQVMFGKSIDKQNAFIEKEEFNPDIIWNRLKSQLINKKETYSLLVKPQKDISLFIEHCIKKFNQCLL